MAKVVVAMSGGVDSSVSALLLRQKRYDVIGLTFRMGRRCDEQSIKDATFVAKQLSIKHDVLDVSEAFGGNVIDYFVETYRIGQTPNPCAKCNKLVKFKSLMDYGRALGADYVASGHYARIIKYDTADEDGLGTYSLCKAKNLEKDQSYFLSTLDYEYLKFIKFPLGNFSSKAEVRKIAKMNNLVVADKGDSQDVCFIDGTCNDYLKDKIGLVSGGYIKHVNGKILGRHNGIFNYTIGQRKGLGVSYGEPLFVVKIDSIANTIYVGSNNDLYSDKVYLYNFNRLSRIERAKEYFVKLRSTHSGQVGFVESIDENNIVLKLQKPARAVTKGQLCCLYDGDIVVGSGWIG